MKSKYTILKELINEWIEMEREKLRDADRLGCSNTYGAGMAAGAVEAYRQVLSDISELEQEVSISEEA